MKQFSGYPSMPYIAIFLSQTLLFSKAKLIKRSTEVLADMVIYPTHLGSIRVRLSKTNSLIEYRVRDLTQP